MSSQRIVQQTVQHIIGLDVDLFLNKPPLRHKILRKIVKPDMADEEVNMSFVGIRAQRIVRVAVLTQYEDWQNDRIRKIVDRCAYNYMIPAGSEDQFAMWRDTFLPLVTISNIPRDLWGGDYSDVKTYSSWQNAVDTLREEIPLDTTN